MKTNFPKNQYHYPNFFILDAKEKILGRFATQITQLLQGKTDSYYSPGVNQGNYVVVFNANKILVSGNKKNQKIYYRNNQRPGSLKQEKFIDLKNRLPSRILEKAIQGMLPKNILGRKYYQRLFIYSGTSLVKAKKNFLIKK